MTQTKQPRGLPVLFMTEFWERYGFYIVQSLLILYIINRFHFSDTISYSLIGAFTALAYIMPVLGGYIADRLLGFRIPIIIGGLLLSAGYSLLALNQAMTLYIGLGCISVGNGLFKPRKRRYLGRYFALPWCKIASQNATTIMPRPSPSRDAPCLNSAHSASRSQMTLRLV